MTASVPDISPDARAAVTKQADRLRRVCEVRLREHSRAANKAGARNSLFGYLGMIGGIGTTFLSKLSAVAVIYGVVTIGDALFAMGLLTAVASGLAAQGLTAKRQETHTEAAVKLDRLVMELERHISFIGISNVSQFSKIQSRLIEIENQIPPGAGLPLLLADKSAVSNLR